MINIGKILKFSCTAAFSIIAFWAVGFLYFIYTLPITPSDSLKKTGAIVVWTGGGCRVATGLELLASGISDKLFISGVYRDVEPAGEQGKGLTVNLLFNAWLTGMIEDCRQPAMFPDSPDSMANLQSLNDKRAGLSKVFQKSCRDCRVNLTFEQIEQLLDKTFIGHQAKTTIGNAIETGRWAKLNQIHSIRLVTSPMHIPRSLIECRRYLPDIQVIMHPVELNKFNHRHWYKDWRIAYKLAVEYSKYLSILLGLRIQRQENLYNE